MPSYNPLRHATLRIPSDMQPLQLSHACNPRNASRRVVFETPADNYATPVTSSDMNNCKSCRYAMLSRTQLPQHLQTFYYRSLYKYATSAGPPDMHPSTPADVHLPATPLMCNLRNPFRHATNPFRHATPETSLYMQPRNLSDATSSDMQPLQTLDP